MYKQYLSKIKGCPVRDYLAPSFPESGVNDYWDWDTLIVVLSQNAKDFSVIAMPEADGFGRETKIGLIKFLHHEWTVRIQSNLEDGRNPLVYIYW